MKTSASFAAAAVVLLSLAGCATQELGRQGELSSYEREAMGCKDIEMEMTRVVGFVEYVNKSMEHNWYDIPAVLEKRWIGNTREKSAALESANIRMVQLWSLHDTKGCNGGVAMQPMGLPVQKPDVEERANLPLEAAPVQPAATPAAKPQPSPAGA
ncbi:MAG TPA: hypothetical protein VFF03_15480 [Rhodocyclaceae bacterium]|nr:hypothetical protein [Rhodocyclaceae bacterium]